jgi:hypothetical protein
MTERDHLARIVLVLDRVAAHGATLTENYMAITGDVLNRVPAWPRAPDRGLYQ